MTACSLVGALPLLLLLSLRTIAAAPAARQFTALAEPVVEHLDALDTRRLQVAQLLRRRGFPRAARETLALTVLALRSLEGVVGALLARTHGAGAVTLGSRAHLRQLIVRPVASALRIGQRNAQLRHHIAARD